MRKKRFDYNILLNQSHFNERGFPEYRRLDIKDLMVVPHNREISIEWDGHANSDFSASVRCVLYLYNYLCKGNKKEKLVISKAMLNTVYLIVFGPSTYVQIMKCYSICEEEM
jgi:hypothetical protein